METLKKVVGNAGERYACECLEHKGYTVIGRNVHISHKEIDIIAEKDDVIIFVEVKARTFSAKYSSPLYRPAEAVNYKKRMNTVSAALSYLSQNNIEKRCRFDVFEIYFSVYPDGRYKLYRINHIESAFDASGNIT